MLRWRLLSASVLITIAVSLAWLDYSQALSAPPGLWMLPLYFTVLGLGTHEMLTLFAKQGWHLQRWPIYFGVFGMVLGCCCDPLWDALDLFQLDYYFEWEGETIYLFQRMIRMLSWYVFVPFLTLLILLQAIRHYNDSGKHVVQLALSYFTILYMGFFGSYFALLRFMDLPTCKQGMLALLSMILIVKASDAGAYACGRLFGRHKLAPQLSPGKTYEGALGGLFVAGVVSLLCFQYIAPLMVPEWTTFEPGRYVAYGFLLGGVGIIGDLAESMLKREMGVKDSGSTLPGLGGVLDVLDSLLTAAPVAYLCWQFGLIAG
jgi:phosphatidate cytidylyltransferase